MNERDLFTAAVAINDPAERASFLDRECAGRADLRARVDQFAAAIGAPEERLREMLLRRALVRFDSIRHYSHSLDELFESLRPAYMAPQARYFAAEAQVVADLLAEGFGPPPAMTRKRLRTPCSWRPTRSCPTLSPPGS
jgi:hypothetical protein